VLDPFAGSGMTGVAACLTGRRAVLNDLSPLSIHLAYNHTVPCSPERLAETFDAVYATLRSEIGGLYWADPASAAAAGYVRYTLWSVVYQCPFCRNGVRYWDAAADRAAGTVSD